MNKTILASAILITLTACGSDSSSTAAPEDLVAIDANTTITDADASGDTSPVGAQSETSNGNTDGQVINDDAGSSSSDGGQSISDDAGSSSSDGGQSISDDAGSSSSDGGQSISDDAGSSSSDGGQSISDDAGSSSSDGGQSISDDAGSSSSDGGQSISDDAGSSSSDGGQSIGDDAGSSSSDGGQSISDDAGSSSSDGGIISDDAGSSSSDGGTIGDDAGSSSSDGGIISDDAGSGSSDGAVDNNTGSGSTDGGNSNQAAVESDAGTFSSGTDGNVIRMSSLTANSTENICTTFTDRADFSDTRVGDFILHNNAWRTFRAAPGYEWEQCITTNTNGAVVGWNYDWGPGISGINGNSSPSGDFYVRSYPELIYGTKDEFRTSGPTSETGLPVRLSEMPTFKIDYSYDAPQFGDPRVVDASNNSNFPNGTIISGERNVAVESFLYEPNAAGNCTTDIVSREGSSNHAYEVMVWLDAGAERLPAGPNEFVADLNVRGADYKIYTKASDPRYIAFVAQNPQSTGTIYMNDYIDWARENAHVVSQRFGAISNTVEIQDDWCMANVLVGTEIFWGAGSMSIFDWTITQSR